MSANSTPSFAIRSRFELVVPGCRRAVISAPAVADGDAELRSKDLLSRGEVASDQKYTLEQHLDFLAAHRALDPRRPLLVLGLRNSLVNPRAVVVVDGRPYAADGEDPDRSQRPYFGIGWRVGVFGAAQALGPAGAAGVWESFFSGIPVLWDDLGEDELLGHILTEASDHSHVYELPRGNHPAATEASLGAWSALHEVFLAHLHADFETAARAMREAACSQSFPLRRCDTYLHSVLGVDARGRLVNVVGHGRLEDLGRAAAALGCRRAVCVENSGSVMPTFFKNGLRGEALPLLRAPNFRPKGRVLLVLELDSAAFDTLSVSLSDSSDSYRVRSEAGPGLTEISHG